MANAQTVYQISEDSPHWHSKQDAPSTEMQTRPVPNNEQHATFQLACMHRDLNMEYRRLLNEFESALQDFSHVLDSAMEKMSERPI